MLQQTKFTEIKKQPVDFKDGLFFIKHMQVPFQLIINMAITASSYALITLGFNLIYRNTKFFNMSHGIAMVGGYVVFFATSVLGWNIFLSIFSGIFASGIIGYWAYVLVFLPLRKRKASSMTMMIASIGVLSIVQSIVAFLFTNKFQTMPNDLLIGKTHIAGGIITNTQILIIFAPFIVLLGMTLLYKKTSFGKIAESIADNENLAKIVGINTDEFIGYIFFIGSAISGLSGISSGFSSGIEPGMGSGLFIKGIIASIIGGIGNIRGGIVGSFLLSFIENIVAWKISGEWKDIISFIMLIAVLILRPTGIINEKK